jgi:hypothetical protein
MKRDVEQFLKQLMVELLALRAQCFLVTLKSGQVQNAAHCRCSTGSDSCGISTGSATRAIR